MTNAQKYLKDEVFYHDLACEIAIFISNSNKKGMVQNIDEFFKQQIKPTLTEDERVILRNIDKAYTHISRTYGDIWVGVGEETADSECKRVCVFNHLFQFIKERRRILNRRTIERRIKCLGKCTIEKKTISIGYIQQWLMTI